MSNNSDTSNPFQELSSKHKPTPRLKKKVLASVRFAVLIKSVLEFFPPHITDLVIKYAENDNK